MPYDRDYRLEEIHQILAASERRPRPYVPPAHAERGHPISQHTEQREDLFDRRKIACDSVFNSRRDLILCLQQALNSPVGKTELRKLTTQNSVRIIANLVWNQGVVTARVC